MHVPAGGAVAPAMPCLRPDAAVLPAGGALLIAMSARHVVQIIAPPGRLADWVRSLDGTIQRDDAVAAAPLPPQDAQYLLGELDRAGLLLDGARGLPFRGSAEQQRDALRVAAQTRDGAIRRTQPPAPPTRVRVCGSADWTRPLTAALAACSEDVRLVEGGSAELLVAIGAAFDPRREDAIGAAMASGMPSASIEVSAADAVFSPLTIPGRTACRRCWELTCDDRPEDWAAWLIGGRTPDAPRLPAHHRALVVAMAVERVLLCVGVLRADLLPQRAAVDARLDLRTFTLTTSAVAPHPMCGCVQSAS